LLLDSRQAGATLFASLRPRLPIVAAPPPATAAAAAPAASALQLGILVGHVAARPCLVAGFARRCGANILFAFVLARVDRGDGRLIQRRLGNSAGHFALRRPTFITPSAAAAA
jgi:hypothetical protein